MAYGDLTTLTDVKAWLQTGQSAFPPTDDALLTRLITAASQYIQTWINRQISQRDYVELRDGTGGQRLQFACFPVSSIQSLTIDGIPIPPAPPPASSIGLTAGYVFSPTQLVVRGYCFTRRPHNIAITYTAGYSTTPPEIAQACIELVALRYRERTRIGEMSKSVGAGETVLYAQKDMSLPIATLLQQYRLVTPIVGYPVMMAPTNTDPATVVAAL